ncbi:NAD-dependent epimerase/dehydratase family protein [Kitasatospora sp. NPDC091335]|uniref:NAD-dependent epimerase/dehydratase family protein n=1 Tax=Kitasatospora sp. NPDC091335 TaxID=3364085 RepID=UPI00381AFD2F
MLEAYEKVLVTGGLGFVGRHLTNSLLFLGKEVTIIDNARTAMSVEPPSGVTLHLLDIREGDAIAEAVDGAELVFHVAANANGTLSVTQPRLDFEINALGTVSFAESLLKSAVRRVVYVSSASVYGTPRRFPMDEDHPTRPFVPYGASKLSGEISCLALHHACGLPVVVGRPFCVYGPGENPHEAMVEVGRFLRWHLNHRPIQIVGDIDRKTRDFVHVTDLVQGLLTIADRAELGEVFNIGSGTETSMRQLVGAIGEATGVTPEVSVIPEIEDDTYRLVGDISKLQGLGYRPAVALTEGVRDVVDHLGANPELPGSPTIFSRGQHGES